MARNKAGGKKAHPRKKSKKSILAKSGRDKKCKPFKKKKRDLTSQPGLKKNLFSKIKQEYHDLDYVDKLSEEEKEWLSRFMEEDLGARLNHDGKKIYKKKLGKAECYRRNNQRNRDLYSLVQATGQLSVPENGPEGTQKSPENALVALIDYKDKIKILTEKEVIKYKDQLTEETLEFYIKHYGLHELFKKTELV